MDLGVGFMVTASGHAWRNAIVPALRFCGSEPTAKR